MQPFRSSFYAFARSVQAQSRLRLAPTPSGFLHAGNAFNFVLNALLAKAPDNGPAKLFLRIDDLDAERLRPEYVQDILESLQWLQLDWTDIPASLESRNPDGILFQSDRQSRYMEVLDKLKSGSHLFACRMSRKALEPYGRHYPPEFRNQGLSLDDPDVAWRIKTPEGFPLSDFVVRRRDGIPAYQLASFTDDLDLGITHVLRGQDLLESTRAQLYLAEVLNESAFLNIHFFHHPLLLDAQGQKLSKSAGASSLKNSRKKGLTPAAIYQNIAAQLDLNGTSLEQLVLDFRRKLSF